MNFQRLLPSNVGAEPKKLAILGAFVAVLGAVYWYNRTPSGGTEMAAVSTPSAPAPAQPAPAPVTRPAAVPQATRSTPGSATARGGNIADFKPTLKLPEGFDVSRIDPALRLELLAKVREVGPEGGAKSLFEFSQPPPPPPPKVKPIVPGPVASAAPSPAEAPKGPPEPPKPPPPPPIPLKFYGYAGTTRSGTRRAFFLDGDDILVAGENETVKNRYRIVRIGVNSAVVEDTTNKNQQTLPLVEEL